MSRTKHTPPRTPQYHRTDELKAAVQEYCLNEFRGRWGARSARLEEWKGLAINPEAAHQARALEREQLARAQPHLTRIAEEAESLVRLYERTLPEKSRRSREYGYKVAKRIRRLAQGELGAVAGEVSRKDWIINHLLRWYSNNRDPRPAIQEMEAHDLAVLGLLAGWWPNNIVVGDEGVSVARVFGREKNCMRSALRGLSAWGDWVMSPIQK